MSDEPPDTFVKIFRKPLYERLLLCRHHADFSVVASLQQFFHEGADALNGLCIHNLLVVGMEVHAKLTPVVDLVEPIAVLNNVF